MKKVVVLISILLIVALVFFGIIFSEVNGKKDGEDVLLTIPNGSGMAQAAEILEEADVIGNALMFRVYAKTQENADKIQAGTHLFRQNMSYKECFEELLRPSRSGETVTVTIPEGFEVAQIALRLEESGVCSATEFMETIKSKSFDYEFLNDLPEREIPLEGYLFPDTYSFYLNSSPSEVIEIMLDRFEEVLYTEENIKKAKEAGYTFDEIVIMASIVEREAAGDIDRSKVASVFYNRLNSSYNYLESCATIQYILGERKTNLTYEDTEINSPYNTYRYAGLPVGPIASPGQESFTAALNPADTDYRYFVVGSDGAHIFSKTYEEHLDAQRK